MSTVTSDYRTLDVELPAANIGAIVHGVDLRHELSETCPRGVAQCARRARSALPPRPGHRTR